MPKGSETRTRIFCISSDHVDFKKDAEKLETKINDWMQSHDYPIIEQESLLTNDGDGNIILTIIVWYKETLTEDPS